MGVGVWLSQHTLAILLNLKAFQYFFKYYWKHPGQLRLRKNKEAGNGPFKNIETTYGASGFVDNSFEGSKSRQKFYRSDVRGS